MSGYAQGVRVEHAVIDHLRKEGYETQRAASSKGIADVIAIREGHVLLINCKRSTMPGPAERRELLRVAGLVPGLVPLVALRPPRQRLSFRLLTGPGPQEWVPWSADLGGSDV